jgi:hypothetical protein
MGHLYAFSRRASQPPDVFSPVNYRPTDLCRTLIFDPADGNGYGERFDAVAVQYALGEEAECGYHVVELPDYDGPLIRYLRHRPNGAACVSLLKKAEACELYPREQVKVLGLIFQFIRDLETGERWELIRGPAQGGEGERMDMPLYDISG